MATVNANTLSTILSGGIALSGATIRTALTRTPDNTFNFLSDIGTPDYTSTSYSLSVGCDTAAYSSTLGAYLSTNFSFFSNISTDYTSGDSLYAYHYADTGSSSTSNIISFQDLGNPAIYGPTTFVLDTNKMLNLTDGSSDSRTLYRDFRLKMLNNQIGAVSNRIIMAALVNASYTFDIMHSTYPSVSTYALGTASMSGVYIQSNSVKTTYPFTPIPITTPGTATSIVFYISAASGANMTLVGQYGLASLTPSGLAVTAGTDAYISLASNTLFEL